MGWDTEIIELLVAKENRAGVTNMFRILRFWWAGFKRNDTVSLEDALLEKDEVCRKRFYRLRKRLQILGQGDARAGLQHLAQQMTGYDKMDFITITRLLHGRCT